MPSDSRLFSSTLLQTCKARENWENEIGKCDVKRLRILNGLTSHLTPRFFRIRFVVVVVIVVVVVWARLWRCGDKATSPKRRRSERRRRRRRRRRRTAVARTDHVSVSVRRQCATADGSDQRLGVLLVQSQMSDVVWPAQASSAVPSAIPFHLYGRLE